MSNHQSLVETKLHPQGRSGKDIIYPCPKCENLDTGHHLYVNYDNGKWHCFKCGAGGRHIGSLLKLLNISSDYDYEKLYSEQEKLLDDIISIKSNSKETKLVDYSTSLDTLTKYDSLHIKPLSEIAYNYLVSRGLTPEIIYRLGICEGISRFGEKFNINGVEHVGRDYSGRIMIPSIRKDGLISFYLGRDYTGTKSNKYINPPKEIGVASEDVWSLDILDTNSVIICEGVFSAIAVNNALGKLTACATYGKSIAQRSSEDKVRVTSQGEKLLNKNFETYIMFYDKDALADAYKNGKYLYDRGARVRIVKIPDDMYGPKADANDMTREEIIRLILDSLDFDVFSTSGLTLRD